MITHTTYVKNGEDVCLLDMVQQSRKRSKIYLQKEQLEVLKDSISIKRFVMNCLEVFKKVICHATHDIQEL